MLRTCATFARYGTIRMAKEWTPKKERLSGTRWIARLLIFIPRQRGQRPRLPAADASKAWHSDKNRLTLRAVFAYTPNKKRFMRS